VSGLYDVYGGNADTAIRAATQVPANDPFTIVPVMACATDNLCFGVTGSVATRPPYEFARLASSLDHLTKGRLGWNIVTGYLDSEARGSGKKSKEKHDTRYDIAHEYMEIVYRLWEESWDDDAVVQDRDAGVFTDPAKVHRIDHDGTYFRVSGIHICEPSPQRTPVLFQAGTSSKGRAFAGQHAECVFIAGNSAEAMAGSVKALREEAVERGRKQDDLKIFGLITVIVAETDDKARDKFAEYQKYGLIEGSLAVLSGWTGIDLSQVDPNCVLEDIESDAIQSALRLSGARTLREWAQDITVGGTGEVLVGSPESVADQLIEWFEISGIDGFNLAYTVMPESIEDFVDMVVPVLQRRGVFKHEYTAGTFREKLFGKSARLSAPHVGASYRRQTAIT
ncbi:MAG: NtaA/DmoA family FMN-dependent monooxygenase, partial [Novosphingobium sp.]